MNGMASASARPALTKPYRWATSADIPFIVPLVAESSGGVWPAVWKALSDDGEPVEASGAKYLADPTHDVCFANAVLAEADSRRLGVMIAYPEEKESPNGPETDDRPCLPSDLEQALRPYRLLRDPDSLFIAELCCLPEARGQGLGSRFLACAREIADARGLPRLSLRVFSANVGAVRLYERCGFKIIDRQAVIPHPCISVGGSVFLMSAVV